MDREAADVSSKLGTGDGEGEEEEIYCICRSSDVSRFMM